MKFLRLTFVLACCLVVFAACDKEKDAKPDTPSTAKIFGDAVESFGEENVKVGGIFAFMKSGDEVVGSVYGDSSEGVPLTKDMAFGIGSNTKTFTAVAILKLVEDKKISLDDNLAKLLPGRVKSKVRDGNATVRQLLTHNTGFDDILNRDMTFVEKLVSANPKEYTPDELMDTMVEVTDKPGDKYSYSNMNYFLLGEIIESVTKKKYHEYLQEVIFTPLHLKHTFVQGYQEAPDGLKVADCFLPDGTSLKEGFDRKGVESVAWAAGSIFSTGDDLMVFYSSLFDGKVINAESLEFMTTFHDGSVGGGYGAGLFELTIDGTKYYSHSGQTIAFESLMTYNPTTKKAVMVSFNTVNTPTLQLNALIWKTIK